MKNKYPERLKLFPDNWKSGPVSCESYWWLCEWKRQGWNLNEIIDTTLSWHMSSFNPKSMPIPYEWRDKIENWIAKMGYHFTIKSVDIPDEVKSGARVNVTIENVGVAPIYESIPFVVRLSRDGECYEFPFNSDVREWLPGAHTATATLDFGEKKLLGEYNVTVGFVDDLGREIFLATNAEKVGKFYKIATITLNQQ